MLSLVQRLRREEDGSVIVMIALVFPTLLLVAVLAVDVGNWYVHKRELQVQADAGALAAASQFRFPCTDAPIVAEAQRYAGGERNDFANIPAERRFAALNAQDYTGQSTPGDTELSGSPCADKSVDVKMTERDVPWFFGAFDVPFINARARVEIQRLDRLAGLLPVALPVPNPKKVRVTLVDEGTGTALGATDLVQRPDSGGGLMLWDNAADNGGTPLSVDVTDGRIGVRVALAGGTSTACGDPLVECYDMGSANGLGLIRGWSADPAVGDKDAPRARSVALTPGTCGDAYFNAGPACAIGISAQVDFQGGVPAADRSVTAVVGGTSHPLTRDAATGRWLGGGIAIPAYSGPNDIALRWEQTSGTVGSNGCKSGGGNKCKGDLGVVHRTFSATPARSGPIQLLTVGDQYSPTGANDVQRCSASNATCRHDFVVQIGIAGNLKVDGPGDPPKVLRVGGGGSQNQTIDCDPAISQFKDEIAQGCTPEYQRNTGQACPSPNVFGTPQPWYCVSTQTGAAVNQVPAGLNMRILGSEKPASCTAPNNWPDYQPGDPRIVPLYIVPFGAFQGAGNQTFPVQDFAFFYVTGWTGQGGGFDNPCQGNGDDPVPGNDPGSIVGHFIRYIQTPNTGGGGDQPCDFDQDSISGCIAVLTR